MVDADLRGAVARRLGMKPSEIVDVVEYGDDNACLVTTHDGVQTRIDEQGVHTVATPQPLPRNPATGEVTPIVGEQLVEDEAERCPECLGTGRRLVDGEQPVIAPEITAPSAVDEDSDAVPDGNADVVLAWVGTDPERAQRALAAERDGKQRAGLTAQLEKLAEVEQA